MQGAGKGRCEAKFECMGKLRKYMIMLTLLAMLLLGGCAVEYFGTIEGNNQAGRVLLITGPAEAGPDAYDAAGVLSEKYGRWLIHRELAAETVADPEQYRAAVAELTGESGADALILLPAYRGAADICADTDLLTVAIEPEEDAALIAAAADGVFAANRPAMGEAAIAQAVEMEAKAVAYFHNGGFRYSWEMRERSQAAAEEAGLGFVQFPAALAEDEKKLQGAIRELGEEYGKDIALISDDGELEGAFIEAALATGCICPPQPGLSPYGAYGAAFRVEKPEDRYSGLDEYLRLVNRELVTVLLISNRFATWRRPVISAAADAATEYAFSWLKGHVPSRSDSAALRQCLLNANGKQLETYKKEGVEYANYWLHLVNIRVFDESG